MAGATGRNSDKFMLRFPEGMRDMVKAAADKSGRSMNAEIVYALEVYFRLDGLNYDLFNDDAPSRLSPDDTKRLEKDADHVMTGIRAARRLLYKLEALEQAVSRKSQA